MTQRVSILALLMVSGLTLSARQGHAAESADLAGFNSTVKPFLTQFCVKCHGAQKPKGKVVLHEVSPDLLAGKDNDTWSKVLDQLTLGDMPPEDEKQPTAAQRHRVVAWIKGELGKAGESVESKLDLPGYGNYVPHDVLFGKGPAGPAMSPPRVWRIRPAVYDATIQRVAKGNYPHPFNLKAPGHGFRDYDNQYTIAGPDLNQLMANAKRAVAALTDIDVQDGKVSRGRSTPQHFFDLINPNAKEPTDAQLGQAIAWLYHRVLLRDPLQDEVDRLIAFTRQSMKQDGRLLGVRNMISAVLLNPRMLYRFEAGQGDPDEHGRVMLSPREIAFAISLALTDDRPDSQLLKAADSGKLNTREQIKAQVERLLNDDKIDKPRILGFFREYFEYGGAVDVFKDEALFPQHDPETLVADTDRLIMYFYERDKDVLRELLTTQLSFVQYTTSKGEPARAGRAGLGAYLAYNLPLDWKWTPRQPLTLLGEQRAGVLTQPAWLVAKSDNFDNHAIRRGLWVREKLLGGRIPDLPITVDAQLPNDPTMTLRERMHVTREAYCWNCHKNMNPLGESFEMFDHFGRWRTRELEKPVVTTGSIDRSGDPALEGKVDNAIELVHKLADSDRVRQVFIRYAFRYWMGRNETPIDAATLRRADRDYVNSGGSMKALIVSLLTSDSFLYRKAVE